MFRICRGEMSDAVMTKGQGKAGVDDVAEAGRGLGGPIPKRLGNIRFVVTELPGRIGSESVAEGGGFLGGLGLFEDGGVAELHVELHQDQTAEQEALLS